MNSNALLFILSMLSFSLFSYGQNCEDFDTVNTSTIGGWTEQSQDWTIESNRLQAPAATSWNFITCNGSNMTNGFVSGRAIHSGINQLQFVGLVARYTSDVTNIMLKVQDNGSVGYFNSYFLSVNDNNVFTDISGNSLGSDLNFRMELSGANVRIMIDPEKDGIWNIDTIVVVTNTSSGLCGVGAYSTCYLDDFCFDTCTSVPDPAVSVVGPGYACQLESSISYSTLIIPGATSYDWQYSGTGVNINGNGSTVTLDFGPFATSGSLTVSGINACGTGIASAAYPVTVLEPVTEMGLIHGEDTICQGQSTVLYDCGTLTNALDYIWSYSGSGVTINGTSDIVALTFAANATSGDLTVYGENACGAGPASPAFSIFVNPCSGIDEPENELSIMPNPGSGVFRIDISGLNTEPADLEIMNAVGQTVWSASQLNTSVNPLIVDLSAQPAGTYIVRFALNGQMLYKKLVIAY